MGASTLPRMKELQVGIRAGGWEMRQCTGRSSKHLRVSRCSSAAPPPPHPTTCPNPAQTHLIQASSPGRANMLPPYSVVS